MTVSISLAISHTPWIPERVESMQRLHTQLVDVPGLPIDLYLLETERCPNWVWSHQMWSWAAETEATHCLFLQDDLRVAPDFWKILRAMIEAVPDAVISLYNGHPGTRAVARQGYRWCTTADGLVGMGYVFPRKLLQAFLQWKATALKPRAVEEITEDTLIDLWAMCVGLRIWHPVPTIIDHELSVKSTYGNDTHRYRRPSVTWEDEGMLGEEKPGAPHLGRFYRGVHWMMKQYLKEPDVKRIQECELDVCPAEYGRFFTYP